MLLVFTNNLILNYVNIQYVIFCDKDSVTCFIHLVLKVRIYVLISSRSGSTQIYYYLVNTHIFHIQRLSMKPGAKGGIVI